ncbi:9381_t:CDS:10 [Acaulospora colombiana]|uniref:9381_t:CDS:1 n=1 Tax=Acaulospora colombiana TaxID=27376 RepID=A0ACA9KXG5_9GLOM|nr:9381_t:CDS:10 [Acaulospora colombiana]
MIIKGINVVVTVKNGVKYQGLFHAAHTEGELGVILKLARKVVSKQEEKNTQNRVIPVFILPHKEVMEIHACGVDFSASLDKPLNEREGFRTDADISGRTEIRERELHKWASEESGEIMKGLEDDINPESGDASWDQFAANEKLFGIKTDFNEELYTTKLDRSRADFKERERQAIAIANEITRTSTNNIHVLEERGFLVEDNQLDEEERYGAVMRNRDPSKYMPPALRKIQEQQQLQQQGTAPAAKKSETAKEPTKEIKSKTTEEPQNIKPMPPSAAPVPSPSLPKANPFPPLPMVPFRVETDATSLNPHTAKKPDTDVDGRPIEALIAKSFSKFVNHEKERLQQRKQAIVKKDMDGKVAELLKWRQNFKLNSPIPDDLIPILTKDDEKRQQLAAKSAAAMSEKESEKDKEKIKDKEKEKQESEKGKDKEDDKPKKEKPNSASNVDTKTEISKPIIKIEEDKPQSNGESKSTPEKVTSDKPISAADKAPPQHPSSRNLVTTPTNTQFKLNAKASEWKPNPNAASFTPTPNTTSDKRSPSSLKKNSASLKDGFSPFKKGKSPDNPNSIITTNFEEDLYAQASVNQGFGLAAYHVMPSYRFTGTQFVGVPPMPMQQTTPMQYVPGNILVPKDSLHLVVHRCLFVLKSSKHSHRLLIDNQQGYHP